MNFLFRFFLPNDVSVHSSADVHEARKGMNLTGEKIFQCFTHLCSQIRELFPQADIIYLGTSRCWSCGPKKLFIRSEPQGFNTSGRRNNSFSWRSRTSTEKRKRICIRSKKKACCLPVYHYLRNHFFAILAKNTRSISERNSEVQIKGRLKKVFFCNIFENLKDKNIWDEYGHLSLSGAVSVSEKLALLFKNV